MENLNGLNTFPSECNEDIKPQAKITRANRKMALASKRPRESSNSSRAWVQKLRTHFGPEILKSAPPARALRCCSKTNKSFWRSITRFLYKQAFTSCFGRYGIVSLFQFLFFKCLTLSQLYCWHILARCEALFKGKANIQEI